MKESNPIIIETRDGIVDLLRPKSVGCELGVFEGDFSQSLISSKKFSELYLVDSFNGRASNFDKHYSDASVLYAHVKQRFSEYPEIKVIKEDSVKFLLNTNTRFDFIYIDTVHTFDHLRNELIAAHKCIKPEGYICGHDYCLEFNGVIQAVAEFSEKYKYRITITKEISFPSFIIHIHT